MSEQNKPQEQSLEGLAPYPQQVPSSDPGQFVANSVEGQPLPAEGGSPEMPNPNQDFGVQQPIFDAPQQQMPQQDNWGNPAFQGLSLPIHTHPLLTEPQKKQHRFDVPFETDLAHFHHP